MYTGHDAEGPDTGHDESGHRRAEANQCRVGSRQRVAHRVGDGADNQEGGRDDDGQRGQRGKQVANHGRQHLFQQGFQFGLGKHRTDDGQHRGGVAHQVDRNAQEGQGIPGVIGRSHIGVDQRTADGHRHKGIGAELFGRRESQQNGQEGEQRIRCRVEDTVGAAVSCQKIKGGQQNQDALEHTGTGHGADDRRKNTGDGGQEAVDQVLLFRLFAALVLLCLRIGHAQCLEHKGIDIRHMVADDHLELAAAFHQRDDPLDLLDAFPVCLIGCIQGKPQPGGTVGNPRHVLFAAHTADNLFRQLGIVFACHLVFLLHWVLVFFGQHEQCSSGWERGRPASLFEFQYIDPFTKFQHFVQ